MKREVRCPGCGEILERDFFTFQNSPDQGSTCSCRDYRWGEQVGWGLTAKGKKKRAADAQEQLTCYLKGESDDDRAKRVDRQCYL